MSIKNYIYSHPRIKKLILRFIMHPIKTRPNWWIRAFMFSYTYRGKNSIIYKSVRKDITPFHPFILGNNSVIEDYSCINNAVGEVRIGCNTRIGLHNTIIGPAIIGNNVNLAQNIVVSGINHSFFDSNKRIDEQGITKSAIVICDDVWIGANSVIMAGVKIGNHCVIGAGSIVTKDIPSNSLAFGNPAKVFKSI